MWEAVGAPVNCSGTASQYTLPDSEDVNRASTEPPAASEMSRDGFCAGTAVNVGGTRSQSSESCHPFAAAFSTTSW